MQTHVPSSVTRQTSLLRVNRPKRDVGAVCSDTSMVYFLGTKDFDGVIFQFPSSSVIASAPSIARYELPSNR